MNKRRRRRGDREHGKPENDLLISQHCQQQIPEGLDLFAVQGLVGGVGIGGGGGNADGIHIGNGADDETCLDTGVHTLNDDLLSKKGTVVLLEELLQR